MLTMGTQCRMLVICKYDKWYFGLIKNDQKDEGTVNMQCLHSNG